MYPISSKVLYCLAGILVGVNLTIYGLWVLLEPGGWVDAILKKLFWFCGVAYIIPLVIGLTIDSRLAVPIRIVLLVAAVGSAYFIMMLLPFAVRTYRFDVLTSAVSVLGLGLLVVSLFFLIKHQVPQ